MKFLAYMSKPVDELDIDKALVEIHQQAKAFNQSSGITGVLFYTGEHFLQVIEGPNSKIDELMAMIEQDDRHNEINILFSAEENHQTLQSWNMQPLNLTNEAQFSISTLEAATKLVSTTMKLDAEGFVYMVNSLLSEPEFQAIIKKKSA
jgi:hypothetical protein